MKCPTMRVATVLLLMSMHAVTPASAEDAKLEALVRGMTEAAQKKDTQALAFYLTDASRKRLRDQVASHEATQHAMAAFAAALDTKFGRGETMLSELRDEPLISITRPKSVAISTPEANPDGSITLHVRVTVASTNDAAKLVELKHSVTARKENGEWKLELPSTAEPQTQGETLGATIDKARKRVRDGEYATRQAAMIALDRALRAPGSAKP